MATREIFRTRAEARHPELDAPKGTLIGAFQQFLGIFGPQGLVTNVQTGLSGLFGILPQTENRKFTRSRSQSTGDRRDNLFLSRSGISSERGRPFKDNPFLPANVPPALRQRRVTILG